MSRITEKSIFYHIPKTGGIWVETAMKNAGLKLHRAGVNNFKPKFNLIHRHNTPQCILSESKKGKFSFCFIRNPVDWYISFWKYRKETRTFENFPLDKIWSEDIKEFILNVKKTYPNFVGEMYQCYTPYVDFIGRTENLADDLVKALRLAGETFDEEKLRFTPPQNTTNIRIDEETKQWIYQYLYPQGMSSSLSGQ